MSDFKQAIEWMKEGKKVRRSYWGNKELKGFVQNNFIQFEDKDGRSDAHFLNELTTIEATDWEIFEDSKESLSDKMYSRSSGPDGIRWGIKFEDAKEKIQNAQRRLKELVVDSDYCICCGNEEEKIFKAMNDIFKEEFGEKLL